MADEMREKAENFHWGSNSINRCSPILRDGPLRSASKMHATVPS